MDLLKYETVTHCILCNSKHILSVDPLKMLQNSARNITLVVTWPGEKTATTLSYATSNHPEHRGYKTSKLGDTLAVEANTNY